MKTFTKLITYLEENNKVAEFIIDNVRATRVNIRVFIRTIRTMVFWGWKLRNDTNWDARTIYDILYIKLDALEKEFTENGHCCWNQEEDYPDYTRMLKLREAVKLSKRLSENDEFYYLPELYEAHDAKWGDIEMTLEDTDNIHGKRCIMSRSKVMTKEDKEQEFKEMQIIHEECHRMYTNDKSRLFRILNDNIDYLWD